MNLYPQLQDLLTTIRLLTLLRRIRKYTKLENRTDRISKNIDSPQAQVTTIWLESWREGGHSRKS